MKQEIRKVLILDLEDKIQLQKYIDKLSKFPKEFGVDSQERCELNEIICFFKTIEDHIG